MENDSWVNKQQQQPIEKRGGDTTERKLSGNVTIYLPQAFAAAELRFN